MMILLRGVALSFLCVLIFTTSAAAGAAWVVWLEQIVTFLDVPDDETNPASWKIIQAADNLADCHWTATAHAKRYAELGNSALSDSRFELVGENVVRFTGVAKTATRPDGVRVSGKARYVCLPDTVDPRGPRGR